VVSIVQSVTQQQDCAVRVYAAQCNAAQYSHQYVDTHLCTLPAVHHKVAIDAVHLVAVRTHIHWLAIKAVRLGVSGERRWVAREASVSIMHSVAEQQDSAVRVCVMQVSAGQTDRAVINVSIRTFLHLSQCIIKSQSMQFILLQSAHISTGLQSRQYDWV
jgi:hypothetical protein